jgi:hypothetical protein
VAVDPRMRTRLELLFGGVRMRQDGVHLLAGERDTLVRRSFDDGREIVVRPAFHPSEPSTSFDRFVDREKERLVDVLEAASARVRGIRRDPFKFVGKTFQIIALALVLALIVTRFIHPALPQP